MKVTDRYDRNEMFDLGRFLVRFHRREGLVARWMKMKMLEFRVRHVRNHA